MDSKYTNMLREAVERLQRERAETQATSEESMLTLISRQLSGDAVAESMAREILSECSRD